MSKDKNNLAGYMMSVMSKIATTPRLGNPVYLGGTIVLDAAGEEDVVVKAKSSRDLAVDKISCSIDGTPSDRLDPWQQDVVLTSLEFSSELNSSKTEHVLDGEIPVGDMFGRDSDQAVVDVITKNEEVTFRFRNLDTINSHRIWVSMRCSFYPPILTGLKPIR